MGSVVTLGGASIFYEGNTISNSQGSDNANAYFSTPGKGYVTALNYNNDGDESYIEAYSAVTPNYDATLVSLESDDPYILGGDIILNGKRQAFVRDMTVPGGFNTIVSVNENGEEANADVRRPVISGNGKWVVFDTKATNLVSGVNTHNVSQVYLKNLETGEIRMISRSFYQEMGGGSKMSAFADISDDGSAVIFESDANDLTEGDLNKRRDIFAYFTETDELARISQRLDISEKIYEVCE